MGHSDMRGKPKNRDGRWLAAALVGLISSGAAMADERIDAVLGPAAVAVPVPVSAPGGASLTLGVAAPISDEALGAESGKAQLQLDKVVVNDQDLNGVLQGNVATGTTSGNNTISGEAFSDSNGFITAIQNTGNNVLIQNSTIINIAMEP